MFLKGARAVTIYQVVQEYFHLLVIIGAVEAKQHTCSSRIASALMEHRRVTMQSDRRPGGTKYVRVAPG